MTKTLLSSDEINHVAKLARIKLTSQEKTDFSRQISDLLSYMDRLNQVDTAGVPPTFQITTDPLSPKDLRIDSPQKSLSQKEALATAPKTQNNYLLSSQTIKK